MKRITAALIALCLVLMAQNAFAFSWIFNGDTNLGNPESASGLIAGFGNVGDPDDTGAEELGTAQPIQISGAGTILPSGYPGFTLNFHFNGSTWDSYNEDIGEGTGTGYLDVFAAVLSESGYYWDLVTPPNYGNPLVDVHPLEDNLNLVLGLDPFDSTPDPTNSYWGGTNFEDHIRDDSNEDVTLYYTTDPAKTYYLTLFMQTRDDLDFSSWGTVSNVNVALVPEPASLSLLGMGLLGLLGFKKKKLICLKK